MISPSILLLILNQNVNIPPINNEEAASKPHKNELVISPSSYLSWIAGGLLGSNAVLLCIQLPIHRLTTAKKSPAESPHKRMPVNASSGANIRHGLGNTSSP
jgi:hypothetical protein